MCIMYTYVQNVPWTHTHAENTEVIAVFSGRNLSHTQLDQHITIQCYMLVKLL
jgi:hypothetical protein